MDIFDSVDNAKPSGDVFDAVATGPAPKSKGLLATVGDTFKGAGARMAQGVNESLGSIDRAFGMDDGAKIYQENAEYWKQKAEEAGSTGLAAKIYTGIGEAPAGVAEFMGNVPYAAAKGAVEGYREDGLTGAVSKGALEGVKRLGIGKVFHGIENTGISGMTKASAMGSTMGAQTAAEQYGATGTINPEDVAASTATGAFLSLDGGGKAAAVKRNLLREGVQTDIAQDLSSRTPMTLATARERLQKSKVEIPDTGITDDSVSVDDAIKSANAAVDWTHDERNRLLKELGGDVEEPAKTSPDNGMGGEAVSANFLDPTMIKAVEQRRGAPLKGELTPEELRAQDVSAAMDGPVLSRDALEEVEANKTDPVLAAAMADGRTRQFDLGESGPLETLTPYRPDFVMKKEGVIEPEVIPPEAAKPVPETDQLALPAPEEVKQLPYTGESAKVPETKGIADAQIPPVAGLSEPVDTQVSPEKGEEGAVVQPETPQEPVPATVTPKVDETKQTEPVSRVRAAQLRAAAQESTDIKGGYTGWKVVQHDQGAMLVHPTKDEVIPFTAQSNKYSDVLRAKAEAQAYAMDNPVSVTGESAELDIKPMFSPSPPSPKVEAPAPVGNEAANLITKDKHAGSGNIVTDSKGDEYLVMGHRGNIVTTVPIVDGKAVVNADSHVKFNVNPEFAVSPESTVRTEPLHATGRNYYDELEAAKAKPPVAPAEPDFALILSNLEKQTAVEKGKGNKGNWSVSDFQEYLKESYPSVAGMDKSRILMALRAAIKGKELTQGHAQVIDAFRHDEEALRQKYGNLEEHADNIVKDVTADIVNPDDYASASDFFDAIISENEKRSGYAEARNQGEGESLFEPVPAERAERDTPQGERKTEATDDAGGWQQEVAVSAGKKVPTIGEVQKQGGRRQSTSDLMDAFTPEPAGLFDKPQFSVAKNKTDTPEFKRWFGDSKVVDKDGNPQVVYHGTSTQFNKVSFKKGAQGLFWFTSDKASILNGDAGAQGTSKVMELYAKIENPAGWKEYDKYSVDELEHLGYDGVILPNKDGSFDGFVFKDPSQIKSATKNKGSFDPNNPDIRYSIGDSEATITPEVLSKVTDVLVKALPDKVDLRIVPHIDYVGPGMDEAFAQHGVKSGKVEGLHQAVLTNGELRSIITLAMDGATERTGYHEILHAAESLRLIKSKDLSILERAYPTKDGVDASERRADAFADYVSKKEQPANSLIRAMFDRIISYANRLKSAFNGEGWRTADDVFNDLMGGKMKKNVEDAKPSGPQFAIAGDIPEETKGEKFWRTVQDRYLRVEVLQNFLKEKGVQLSELADVSRGLSVMNGKIADQLKRFLDNRIAPLVKEAGKNKLRLPDIEDFLLMQHAQEANAAMRKLHKDPDATAFGVTDAEAQAKLAAYQSRPDFAQLEKTANKFRAFSDETANMLQNAGIISPEMRQAWDNAYQHYVPVRGGEDNTGTGKGVRVNGKQQRRSGHDKRQEHVIENIVKAREFAVKAIEKNKVALSVAQLIKEAGDDRIGTVGKPEKRRVFSNKAMYTVLHKGEPIAAFDSIEAADKFTAMDKRDGGKLSDYQVKISSDPTVSWATSPTLGDNEINAFVNGHQVRIQINDEIAARALTNGGIEQLATLFKAGKSINNYLSRAYTGYDPRFTIRNTARDFTAGMINLTGDYGAKTAAKIALNYPVAMKEFIKGRKDPASSQWVDRYRKAGGSTGASWLPSIERLGEDIQSMYHEQIGAVATYQKVFQDQIDAGASPMKASIKAATQSGIAGFHKTPVLGHFLKMVEMMNAVSENAFRVATFKTLVEEGKSEAEAGEAAKSSTINFDKKGEWGAQIGALYLFFNPAVQGVRRTGKALFQSEHKFQAQAMAGSMALAGYLAAEAARSMWSDDEWDKIPRSVKNRNLVVRTGEKTQITIPIPYEYGTFVGVGYAVNDMVHGKADKRTGLNLAGTLMDAMSVIGNPVTDKGDIQPLQMMPTLAKLILAPTMNLNNFGGEIQPTKRDSSPKPDSQNMYRNTKGSYYDKAAAKMNELTGGTKYSSGAVDVSPEVLKFYTRSILGGSFTFLDQVLGLGTMTAQGVKPDVGEVPMVNVLARENTVRDTRTAFYEIANDANKALAEYNAAKKGKAFDVAKDLKEQNADLIAVAHIAKTQAKLAKAKRDAADAIRLDDNLSLAEKRERMKALEAKEEIIYNRLISKFNSRD